MLVLFETSSGYALFKLLDDSKLRETENLWKEFESPDKACEIVKLLMFKKFRDTTESLEAANALIEGKCGKTLKKLLKKCVFAETQEQLAVADSKLGGLIKEKFKVNCVSDTSVQELMRGIRLQLDSLIGEIPKKEMAAMSLGLAHSLTRYKLKFNPEKIDTMIVQAVSLLDDLDKELNNYCMRLREWYSWHFPELAKHIQDHVAYAKVVKLIGLRQNTAKTDLSDILPEELEKTVKEQAEISMGTEISELDIGNIRLLCDQVMEISQYRAQLYEYLKNRMMALAPNLTAVVGELVGARLISHAGTLMNLAKYPASTVQILGAEKALFRALKTKKDTPKYGLIYHAQLISQQQGRLKGKISRMLAAKAALSCRVDAFGEDNETELGIEHRAYLESRVRVLQEQGLGRISGTGKAKAKSEPYVFKSDILPYNSGADSTIPRVKKRKFEKEETEEMPKKKKVKSEPAMDHQDSSTAQDHQDSSMVCDAEKNVPVNGNASVGHKIEENVVSKKKKKKKTKELLDTTS